MLLRNKIKNVTEDIGLSGLGRTEGNKFRSKNRNAPKREEINGFNYYILKEFLEGLQDSYEPVST